MKEEGRERENQPRPHSFMHFIRKWSRVCACTVVSHHPCVQTARGMSVAEAGAGPVGREEGVEKGAGRV